MFDPNSFDTELRHQTVTVEIGRCAPPYNGSDVEEPQDLICEFEVFGDDGIIVPSLDETFMIHDLVIEHLKYAAQEVEMERRLSAMEDV